MACRIATTRTTRLAYAIGVALVSALIGLAPRARKARRRLQRAADAATPLSKACQPGATAIAEESPLPNVAAALAQAQDAAHPRHGRGARTRQRARRRLYRS